MATTVEAVLTPGVKPQCGALTSSGRPCRSPLVGADGLCNFHSGRFDPREVGRLGGLASVAKREEQAQHVRERLRRRVDRDFERIWAGISAGLDSDDPAVKLRAATAALANAFGSPAAVVVEDKDAAAQTLIFESAFSGRGNGNGS